jgi:hypothetical protein
MEEGKEEDTHDIFDAFLVTAARTPPPPPPSFAVPFFLPLLVDICTAPDGGF